MVNNIVAFIGIESFDLIHYLSRILVKLGKKVLVIDNSETGALSCSIPKPQGIDINHEIVMFRHVDLTSMMVDREIQANYDDILVACGFTMPDQDLYHFNKTIIVTDLFLNNIERISRLCEINSDKKYLVVRNIVGVKITPWSVAEQIDKEIPIEDVTSIYLDENDQSNAILCQYNQSYRFRQISKQMKDYLCKTVKVLYPEIEVRQLQKAYKEARKGD